MYDKAVNSYPSAIKFVLNRFKMQQTCNKSVDTCQMVFDSVPDQYITEQ